MRTLTLLALVFIAGLVVVPAGAEEILTPLTKSGEVLAVDMVQVEISKLTQEKKTITLAYINTQLAVLNAKIQDLQKQVGDLEVLKVKIGVVAATVELKVEEVLK